MGGLLTEPELLRHRTCCTLNYICNFLRMRHVNCVACTGDFDRVTISSLGIPTFQVRIYGSIAPATSIQLGLFLQAAVVIVAEKLSAKLNTCERAMKAACSAERSAAKYS